MQPVLTHTVGTFHHVLIMTQQQQEVNRDRDRYELSARIIVMSINLIPPPIVIIVRTLGLNTSSCSVFPRAIYTVLYYCIHGSFSL